MKENRTKKRDTGRNSKRRDGAARGAEFQGPLLEPFSELLGRHNAKKDRLMQWREEFRSIARKLAEWVKADLSLEYANQVYPHVRPDPEFDLSGLPHSCLIDQAHFESVFGSGNGAPGGSPDAFNPWVGRWRGWWTSGEGPDQNFEPRHVWDQTQSVGEHEGEEQFVQPVTQSNEGFVGREELDTDPGQEGVQPPEHVDLAINVWGKDCGITGWVSKPRDGYELPHIGYRVAPGIIVWITQRHFRSCRPFTANEPFFLYFEWIDEKGTYGILGRRFRLRRTATGGIDTSDPIDPVRHGYPNERHGGLYRKQ